VAVVLHGFGSQAELAPTQAARGVSIGSGAAFVRAASGRDPRASAWLWSGVAADRKQSLLLHEACVVCLLAQRPLL